MKTIFLKAQIIQGECNGNHADNKITHITTLHCNKMQPNTQHAQSGTSLLPQCIK